MDWGVLLSNERVKGVLAAVRWSEVGEIEIMLTNASYVGDRRASGRSSRWTDIMGGVVWNWEIELATLWPHCEYFCAIHRCHEHLKRTRKQVRNANACNPHAQRY